MFPIIFKRIGDMARFRLSDCIAINGEDKEATWHAEKRLIARGFTAVDLHLSEGGTWRDRIHWIAF